MYSAEGSRSRIKQILLNPQSDNSDCFTLISVLWGETVENHLLQLLQTIHDFQRLGHRHALLGWRPLWTGSFPAPPPLLPSPGAIGSGLHGSRRYPCLCSDCHSQVSALPCPTDVCLSCQKLTQDRETVEDEETVGGEAGRGSVSVACHLCALR